MGRRPAIFALVLIVALGAFIAYRSRPEPPEPLYIAPAESEVIPDVQPPAPVSDKERVGRELTATLALASGQGFPAALPWAPVLDIGGRGGFPLENMLHARPLAFLELCLERYQREVRGYNVTFVKKERIHGKVYPPEKDKYEVIKVAFRERPFSVFFNWLEKAKLAKRALYVEGENDGKVLGRPFVTFLPIMTREVDGTDAKNSSRYTIAQFGIGKGTERTVASMQKAQARGVLHLRYEGLVKLAEVGHRVCYKFVRTPYDPPEEEGVNELTVYIDRETWLQVGSVLRDTQGRVIAEYFFKDVELNPTFSEKQFTRAAL